ncbi:MAG: aminotransferase class III-fold pyridoxal phosphate-dependent enzyme, partial [SAR202 cluster bacterium]|nr:aminotransferase class III-fold pyridoxal phosphate-dependent enzyme [SAR202 cluster bacterium]
LTNDHGALLIFDEVITGFRVAWGGAQALYGVTPDMTCLGKIVGGGMPLAAYGGRREVMEGVAPLGPMYQAGTLSGNPVAVAAGIATVKALQIRGTYEKLEETSAQLERGLRDVLRRARRNAALNRVGSVMTLFFNDGPVTTWADVARSDTKAYADFFHGMLDRGVYLAPSAFEAAFVSAVHVERDIDETVAAARQALTSL